MAYAHVDTNDVILVWLGIKKLIITLTSQNDLCPYKFKLGIPTTYPMVKVFFIRKMAIFFFSKTSRS